MIEGELTVGVIPAFIDCGYAAIDAAKNALTIDLSGVTHVDSASLALLIDWIRYAKERHKTLTFMHLPEKIKQMMTLSNMRF